MNLRWLNFDDIDPALKLLVDERRQVRNRIHLRADEAKAAQFQRRYGWVFVLAPAVIYVLIVIPVFMFLQSSSYFMLMIPLLAVCMLVALAQLRRWSRRPLVLLALRHYGYEVCVRCGYYLKGVPADSKKCPECGAAREALPEQNKSLKATGHDTK